MKLGYSQGETCNREGCKGIIEEMYMEGSCSCHINPPCSYCETAKGYCESCGWDGKEEQEAFWESQSNSLSRLTETFYEKRAKFRKMYNDGEGCKKLEYIIEEHTSFTMKITGIYPNGSISDSELMDKVRGTFGGRFEYYHTGDLFTKFIYISYTD